MLNLHSRNREAQLGLVLLACLLACLLPTNVPRSCVCVLLISKRYTTHRCTALCPAACTPPWRAVSPSR